MNIETKLNVGDRFYIIYRTTYQGKETCAACKGLGYIKLPDENRYSCPSCYGKGNHEKYESEKWRVMDEGECCSRPVGKIEIEVDEIRNQIVKIKYSPKNMGNYFYEENCFKTLEDARVECKKRNNEQ